MTSASAHKDEMGIAAYTDGLEARASAPLYLTHQCRPNSTTTHASRRVRRSKTDTPRGSRESAGGPSATTTHDDSNFDGTGLHVWPGSRLLARFLAEPSGARRLFPQFVTRQPGCAPPLHGGGSSCDGQTGDMRATSSSNRKMTPSAEAAADGRRESSPRPRHRTAPHQDSRCVAVDQSSAPPTVLELGAGTGVCGMAASLSLGCSVVLTDRRSDILENLRKNINLNGLATRARVVRLEWGRKSRSCPAEIRELSPFKVILASDTVYPGKPFSDTEAFFAMAAELLDPEVGVLLLTYTPRQPSTCTENMLRCAYRAGLRGTALWNEHGDRWREGNDPRSLPAPRGVGSHNHPLTDPRHGSAALKGVDFCPREQGSCPSSTCTTNGTNAVLDPRHAVKCPLEVDNGKGNNLAHPTQSGSPRPCEDCSHPGTTPNKPPLRDTRPVPDGCTPILLAFELCPKPTDRDGSLANNPELAWLSEWKFVFPDLQKRLECRPAWRAPGAAWSQDGAGALKNNGGRWDDASAEGGEVTAEYLWGSSTTV
ncbi:unnamed protein product [Ectocarpus sp. CCAP 1310/34]|nr:unnamed protein product [Ectocarpus sp. CCAP 1310/34]